MDAVVLAAGGSVRMGAHDKLLLVGGDGRALIARTVGNVVAGPVREVWVVVEERGDAVRQALRGVPVRFVACADAGLGMGHSVRCGVAAVRGDAEAVMVCLGDMPLVAPATIAMLVACFVPGAIVVPTFGGRRGNPVVWDRRFVPELLALTGDRGGRVLLDRHAAQVRSVVVADEGVLLDADTPAAVRALPGGPWRVPDGTLI